MKEEVLKNFEYEEVEDIIFEIVVETNLQKEGIIKDYKIKYKDNGEFDNIRIIKKKDRYLINVNGFLYVLKRDWKVNYKLMLKIYDMLKQNTVRLIPSNTTMYLIARSYDNF